LAPPIAAAGVLSRLAKGLGIMNHMRSQRARSCWLTTCAGCAGCVGIAVVIVMSLLGAAVSAVATLAGAAGPQVCPGSGCIGPVAGAPISCSGMYVSQGFGDTRVEHPHTGIDIVCPAATVVLAVTAGRFHQLTGGLQPCRFPAGKVGGLGTYGEVQGPGIAILYGHLSGFAAPDGSQVVPGQALGFEGSSGCSSGYHLHFEVDVAGRPVNPCPYLPNGYPSAHELAGRCWGSAPP
jgi:murein DD-endopeptidase MepM/ murein hydrolase activator NlpD